MYKLALRLDVGSQAEDFTLNDFTGKPFRLGDLMGKAVVFLTFYRGGFDRESVRYLEELAGDYKKLRELGVEAVAVTPELPEKVKATAEALRLPFTALSDPGLKVTRQYDVYSPADEWCWPAGFIIGRDGEVQYAYRGVSPPNTPPLPYLLKKFEQMRGQSPGAPAAAI
jgi:peroxiredoxin Q/BCP